MILGRVLEQGAVGRQACVVEVTWESGIRTFLELNAPCHRIGREVHVVLMIKQT
jgi:hypothetical protein